MRKLILLLVLAGIARPVSGQQNARGTLMSADLDLASTVFLQGMSVLAGKLGTDGVLAWPGAAVVTGEPAAAKFFAHQPFLAETKISWQPFRIEMAPDSSLGFLVGVAVMDRPATDPIPALHRIGRYVEVWKRVDGKWQLAAFTLINLFSRGETIWTDATGPRELPTLPATGPAAPFIRADSIFAADAGAMGASKAFERWAAPDATTFASTGELNVGPVRIGAALSGNTSHWGWGAVAAGASADGMLGWTVGQATITPAAGGAPTRSKYLTLWRKMPDGSIRFIADGGNARP